MKMGVLAAPLAAMTLAAACSSGPYDPNNESEAEAQCEGFVEKRLKAPSTADYDLTATESAGEWTVTGTVDAENGFGAKIRSDVMCVIRFEGDTAHLEDIAIS